MDRSSRDRYRRIRRCIGNPDRHARISVSAEYLKVQPVVSTYQIRAAQIHVGRIVLRVDPRRPEEVLVRLSYASDVWVGVGEYGGREDACKK